MKIDAQLIALATLTGYPRNETRWLVEVGHGVCSTAAQGFLTEEAARAWAVGRRDLDPTEPQSYSEVVQAPDYLNDLNAIVPLIETRSPTIERLDHDGPGRWDVTVRRKDRKQEDTDRLCWRVSGSGYGPTLALAIAMAVLKDEGLWVEDGVS